MLSCKPGPSNNDSIATDSITIAAGEKSFNINCSGCHNFRQDAIGPQLSGLTNDISADWIENFIKDPEQLINSKDAHAVELHEKYKTTMPAFSWLKANEIKKHCCVYSFSQGKSSAGSARKTIMHCQILFLNRSSYPVL
jgi:hypothetical protein